MRWYREFSPSVQWTGGFLMLYGRELIDQFPVRKSKRQKSAFREAVLSYGAARGYMGKVESGTFGSKNVVFGDPEQAEYLVTAHYDTCARLPFPNFITPCHLSIYLLYQLFLCAVIILVPCVIGIAVGILVREPLVASVTAEVLFILVLILMLFGPANPSNLNDNSSGVLAVLDLMAALPEAQREKVCFVLFDLEEAGLFGSAGYRKAHRKASQRQLVLNMDCVGDGDEILLFPKKSLRRNGAWMDRLRSACLREGEKEIRLVERGFAFYPSDQMQFPLGIGIAALRKTKGGIYYLSRIHTPKDTILEENNILLLRSFCLGLLSQPEGKKGTDR